MAVENNDTEVLVKSPVLKTTKLTFSQLSNHRVGSMIDKFQKLSRAGECVLGSGGCAFHNVKLVRGVKKKRMSVKDDKGVVRWVMCDVTSLVCPVAQRASEGRFGEKESENSETDMKPSLSNDKAGTNKRLRFQQVEMGDQSGSHSQHTEKEGRLSLDDRS